MLKKHTNVYLNYKLIIYVAVQTRKHPKTKADRRQSSPHVLKAVYQVIDRTCLSNQNYTISIGIKHVFSCINFRQFPREVLKTEATVFNTSLGTWRMLMHWKTMFDRYYCIKTENSCYISRYFLLYFVSPFHRCLANAIFTDYVRSRCWQCTSRNDSKSMAPVRSYWKLRSRALTARELSC